MGNNECSLFSFLCAAKGNWRNSFYIECRRCRYGRREPCSGFLLVPDYDGQPVIIPAGVVQSMTGLAADKEECRAVISLQDFETLYALWLEWNVGSANDCPLTQIASRTSCGRAEKGSQCCFQKITDGQCVLNP